MTNLTANCPVCDEQINIPNNTEVSEILSCPGCQNRVVVTALTDKAELDTAPEIEEDWGE
jgi:lysine biosynthesis protein LysW